MLPAIMLCYNIVFGFAVLLAEYFVEDWLGNRVMNRFISRFSVSW